MGEGRGGSSVEVDYYNRHPIRCNQTVEQRLNHTFDDIYMKTTSNADTHTAAPIKPRRGTKKTLKTVLSTLNSAFC